MKTHFIAETQPMEMGSIFKDYQPLAFFIALIALWCAGPAWLSRLDETTSGIDQSIWLLILLSMICFLLLVALSWWLLSRFWMMNTRSSFTDLVAHLNSLPICQQLIFYWASFALLLVSAALCLIAIC